MKGNDNDNGDGNHGDNNNDDNDGDPPSFSPTTIMSGIPGHVHFLIINSSPPKEVFLPEEALDSSLLAINYAAGYTDAMVDTAIPSDFVFSDLLYTDTPLADRSTTPYHPPIPSLIKANGVNEGDINVLLGSLTDLPFPTAFKTLLGSAMALWAASAPDAATVN